MARDILTDHKRPPYRRRHRSPLRDLTRPCENLYLTAISTDLQNELFASMDVCPYGVSNCINRLIRHSAFSAMPTFEFDLEWMGRRASRFLLQYQSICEQYSGHQHLLRFNDDVAPNSAASTAETSSEHQDSACVDVLAWASVSTLQRLVSSY